MEKIDILLFNRARRAWVYECTTHADTLREAKARYLATVGRGLSDDQVKAEFSDTAERRERLEARRARSAGHVTTDACRSYGCRECR